MASNEKEIRQSFRGLIEDHDKDILIIDEFCGGTMKTRADLALVQKESFIMVEIKSNKDTLDRLTDQIRDYNLYSGKVIVILDVVHKKAFDKLYDKKNMFRDNFDLIWYDNGLRYDINNRALGYLLKTFRRRNKVNVFDLLWSKEKKQFISFIKGRTKIEMDIAIKNIYTYQELVELSHATIYDRLKKNQGRKKDFSINNNIEFGTVPEIKHKEYKQILFNDLLDTNNKESSLF